LKNIWGKTPIFYRNNILTI